MSSADVVLENITKVFGDTVAVSGVSIAVEEGEFLSMIGPSGCGKTTTLRMIAGLEKPTSGAVYIKGDRMDQVPAHKRNTGMVFQSFALFPHMNVQKNVEFGLRMRGDDKATREEKIRRGLATVGLDVLGSRSISQLSGGQKQRVALARALVTEPHVLLLDEPLGSLDASLRIVMQGELKALQKKLGITFIHVTHNQSEALAMADRIVVMNEGMIEQIGTPEEIFDEPKTRFVAQFVGKNNLFDGVIEKVEGELTTVASPLGKFQVICESDRCPEVGKEAVYVVRADCTKIGEGGEPSENRLSGVLQGEEHVGNIVTYFVSLENGQQFKLEQHKMSMRVFKPNLGERLSIAWRAEDAHLLL
ncbi:MAG: ABC transporter ATP-binding protein [Chloroflexi bacterium]|nr:ABC transporter ATP-binding protein [Chloroflexota bacterium]